jgi:hypothetical protein
MASDNRHPVFKVERGCPAAPMGCGCTGQCHELIDVVSAEDYFLVVGQRDELRRMFADRGTRSTIPDCERPTGGV